MGAFLQKKHTSAAVITLILSLTAGTESNHATLLGNPALAQSNSTFKIPDSVASGTQLKIDGSSSMDTINKVLKQKFEEKYSGTSVKTVTSSSEASLKALAAGKADVAAIARPLTETEKGEGIKEVPVSLKKIAIIVGADNPFKGTLTIPQFAKIFRGEITNWKEVGGPDAPIKFIDRPETSDIRQAFQRYPVFQSAPFKAGATALPVEDSTDAVIAKLGQDGVGYAIAAQVVGNPKVHVLEMHKTPPTNPKYPFSQPLGYAYKEPLTSSGTEAFLGIASAPENDGIIETATQQSETTAGASGSTSTGTGTTDTGTTSTPGTTTGTGATGSPTTSTGAAASPGGFNPWWLAPLLLVPLLWWGLGRKKDDNDAYSQLTPETPAPEGDTRLPSTGVSGISGLDTEAFEPTATRSTTFPGIETGVIATGAAAVAGAAAAGMQALGRKTSRLVLTPRGARSAYAYWEIPENQQPFPEKPALRLYDVTNVNAVHQAPLVGTFETEADDDLIVPLPASDRDYQAELGYTNREGNWVSLARSNTIHEDPNSFDTSLSTSVPTAIGGTNNAVESTGLAVAGSTRSSAATPRLILTPRGSKSAYAYWEIPTGQQPNPKLSLRMFDVTETEAAQPGSLIGEFETEADNDLIVPLPISDRTYQATLGYINEQNEWVEIARSNAIEVESENPMNQFFEAASGTVLAAGAGIVGLVSQSGDAIQDAASNAMSGASTILSGIGERVENLKDSASNAVGDVVNNAETMLSGLGGNDTETSTSNPDRDGVGDSVNSVETILAGLGSNDTETSASNPTDDDLFDFFSEDTVVSQSRSANEDTDSSLAGGITAMGAAAAGAAAGLAGGLGSLAGKVGSTIQEVSSGIVDKVQDVVDPIGSETTELGISGTQRTEAAFAEDVGNAETELGVYGLSRQDLATNSRVVFIARSATSGYAYWELTAADQNLIKPQGENELKLRLYDVTGLAGLQETPRGVYQVDCQISDRDQHLSIPVTDRDYMVEVGFTQDNGRWVAFAASDQVHFSSEITRLL